MYVGKRAKTRQKGECQTMAKQNLEQKPGISRNYVWFMLVTLLIFAVGFALLLGGISGTNFQEHGALIQVITFFLAFMPILLVLIAVLMVSDVIKLF